MYGNTHGSHKSRYKGHFLRGNKNNIDVKLCVRRLLLQARINKKLAISFLSLFGIAILLSLYPSYTSNRTFSLFGYTPIVVGVYFVDGYISSINSLPIHNPDRYPSKRQVYWTDEDEEGQDLLNDEKYYDKHRREEPLDKSCELFDWQRHIKPTCNSIHENDLTDFFIENHDKADERVRLIAHGFWRDVWKIRRDGKDSWSAFKTIRTVHDYTDRNFDRHERDAIVMDLLTKSQHIVKMHSFCGHSTFTEFTTDGSLSDLIWPPDESMMAASMRERLDMAIQIAKAVSDVHFTAKEDIATVSHADISPSQFLFIDGIIKLNDFNRCRFIRHKRNGDQCTFMVSSNPGTYRSPEEYKFIGETEKIDVYSMGNVFYSLIEEEWPFEGLKAEDAQKLVADGKRPELKAKENITDPSERILTQAIEMCWIHDPKKRPSSKEILKFLQESSIKLG